MDYIKDGLEGQIRIFVKSHLFGRYGSVAIQQQCGGMIQEVCFLCLFQNSLLFVVDKIPHSQGTIPYLGISKIWTIQLLLLDFIVVQW